MLICILYELVLFVGIVLAEWKIRRKMNDNFHRQYTFIFNYHKQKFNTEDPLSNIIFQINKINKALEEGNISEESRGKLLQFKKSFELHRDIIVRGFDSLHFLGFFSE